MVVVETELGLYTGSVEEVGDAGAFGLVADEGVSNAGPDGPFDSGVPLAPPPVVVACPSGVLFPLVVADPPWTAGPVAACPLLPQPRGAKHARSATARSWH